MANRRSPLRKMNSERLKRSAKTLGLGWAIICSAPLWVVTSSLQERKMRLAIMENAAPVTAIVTAHNPSRNSCAMTFRYYWKKSYVASVRGCPEPVGRAFTAMVNTSDPASAIPRDQVASMERSEFWEIAFFGGIVALASLALLPSLIVYLFEIARRRLRQ